MAKLPRLALIEIELQCTKNKYSFDQVIFEEQKYFSQFIKAIEDD